MCNCRIDHTLICVWVVQASITKLPIELETQSQALPDYVTQQVLQRTEELRREGRDPRGELSTVLGVTGAP